MVHMEALLSKDSSHKFSTIIYVSKVKRLQRKCICWFNRATITGQAKLYASGFRGLAIYIMDNLGRHGGGVVTHCSPTSVKGEGIALKWCVPGLLICTCATGEHVGGHLEWGTGLWVQWVQMTWVRASNYTCMLSWACCCLSYHFLGLGWLGHLGQNIQKFVRMNLQIILYCQITMHYLKMLKSWAWWVCALIAGELCCTIVHALTGCRVLFDTCIVHLRWM
jgi:hypothetical protein